MCPTAGCWSGHRNSLGLRLPVLYVGTALPVTCDPGSPALQETLGSLPVRPPLPASESLGSWGMAPRHLDCRPALQYQPIKRCFYQVIEGNIVKRQFLCSPCDSLLVLLNFSGCMSEASANSKALRQVPPLGPGQWSHPFHPQGPEMSLKPRIFHIDFSNSSTFRVEMQAGILV